MRQADLSSWMVFGGMTLGLGTEDCPGRDEDETMKTEILTVFSLGSICLLFFSFFRLFSAVIATGVRKFHSGMLLARHNSTIIGAACQCGCSDGVITMKALRWGFLYVKEDIAYNGFSSSNE